MKNQHLKNIAILNVAMLFISTSGVLGRSLSLSPTLSILWRSFFAIFLLGAFCWYSKISFKINSKKDLGTIILSGLFLGAHWITYFYSLQLSNVAIALLSLFTYPIITTFLEPLFHKTKLHLKHVILGFIVLLGIYFLSADLQLESDHTKGILIGLVSAVFYAIRNLILKKHVTKYNGSMLMLYQVIIVTFVLSPLFFFTDETPKSTEWIALLLLALLTTTIGHTLFLKSFKNFSVTSASIIGSIQPIYGIILGILFLKEIPNPNTIIGGVLILTSVVIESIHSRKS